MAIIRENARSGVALFTLLASGCVSTDEPLFRSVPAPEERSDAGASAVAGGAASFAPPAESVPAGELVPAGLERVPVEGLMPGARDSEAVGTPGPGSGEETSTDAEEPALAYAPCSAPGLLWCDTFDDATAGTFPDAPHWLDELPGCGSHVIDDSGVSLSGTQALRVARGGYPECMLHALLEDHDEVFVRSHLWIEATPGLLDEYISVLEWGPRANQDEPELRIGLRPSGGSLCGTSPGLDVSVSGLARGPATTCTGVMLEPERWYCLQARVSREPSTLSVSVSLDGEPVLDSEYQGLNPGWAAPNLYFKLGRAAYGPAADGSIWHDDVAIGSEPLPCAP